MTMYGGRDAATGAAVRPPDLAVVRQVDHDLVSVMLRIVTLTSAVLARVRLRGAAPAPVEQDGDGLYAAASAWRMMAARERTASPV